MGFVTMSMCTLTVVQPRFDQICRAARYHNRNRAFSGQTARHYTGSHRARIHILLIKITVVMFMHFWGVSVV